MLFSIELVNLIHIVIIITSPRVYRILFLYLMHGLFSFNLFCAPVLSFITQFTNVTIYYMYTG